MNKNVIKKSTKYKWSRTNICTYSCGNILIVLPDHGQRSSEQCRFCFSPPSWQWEVRWGRVARYVNHACLVFFLGTWGGKSGGRRREASLFFALLPVSHGCPWTMRALDPVRVLHGPADKWVLFTCHNFFFFNYKYNLERQYRLTFDWHRQRRIYFPRPNSQSLLRVFENVQIVTVI